MKVECFDCGEQMAEFAYAECPGCDENYWITEDAVSGVCGQCDSAVIPGMTCQLQFGQACLDCEAVWYEG